LRAVFWNEARQIAIKLTILGVIDLGEEPEQILQSILMQGNFCTEKFKKKGSAPSLF